MVVNKADNEWPRSLWRHLTSDQCSVQVPSVGSPTQSWPLASPRDTVSSVVSVNIIAPLISPHYIQVRPAGRQEVDQPGDNLSDEFI